MLRAFVSAVRPFSLLVPLCGMLAIGCAESARQAASTGGSESAAQFAAGDLQSTDEQSLAGRGRYEAPTPSPADATAAPMEAKAFDGASIEAARSDALAIPGAAEDPQSAPAPTALPAPASDFRRKFAMSESLVTEAQEGRGPGEGGDQYAHVAESDFVAVKDAPFSTFSIDVDTASYSKTRMYLLQHGRLPPPDAVRIEELVNYFDYDYEGPAGDEPFAVHTEVAGAPWNTQHLLARVALQGRRVEHERSPRNLVFLIDVSGSMNRQNKLPLVKEGLRMLTSQLDENDRVAIVVYAGAAGLVLPPTYGDNRHVILDALDRLQAGGSTNGGEGIRLAYSVAREQFIPGGVNRVVLCSDGDFNVGTTSTGELVRLAEEHARANVYLSVLGFGMGNHNDAMLEELSNKANGNYAFIDSDREARKVLLDQIDSTLVTIAKDVKIQVEFNPAVVAAYRLIGYENRRLRDEDFNDDKKDAGEIGAGHNVTALYELVLAGEDVESVEPRVNDLRYQTPRQLTAAAAGDELLTVNLRFKQPDEDHSSLQQVPVKYEPQRFTDATADFQFAAAVAAFGMLLRNSSHHGDANYDAIQEIATASRGSDEHGYRSEFLQLVDAARRLTRSDAASTSFAPPLPPPDRTMPSTPVVTVRLPATKAQASPGIGSVFPQATFGFDLPLLVLLVVALWVVATVACLPLIWVVIRATRLNVEAVEIDEFAKPSA